MRPVAAAERGNVVCLSVCRTQPRAAEMPAVCEDVDSGGPKEQRGAGIPRGRDNFFRTGEHFPAHCEVHVGLYGISGVSQSYPVRGSTDAAYRCQYCSNLL